MRPTLVIGVVALVLLTACGQPAGAPPPPTAPAVAGAPASLTTPAADVAPTGSHTATPSAPASPEPATPAPPTSAAEPAATAPAAGAQELTIFAVAPFSEALPAIGEGFRAANPGVTLSFNFAGGPQLAAQLREGATADLLAFNEKLLPTFVETGRVISGTEQLFARSQPVLIVPADNPAQIESLADLSRPGLRLVLGDEATAIGQYSLAVLDRASGMPGFDSGYKDAVLANVRSYEASVRAVLAKVTVGEADAAIVYASDVAGPVASEVRQIDLPPEISTMAKFYTAGIADSDRPALALAFLAYLQTPDAQAVLAQYGFMGAE